MEGRNGKVLIVDSDKNSCNLINLYIEGSSYETSIVNNGKEAQERFKSFSPDIVILDIILPDISGIDLLKWIRKNSQLPVIILTAKDDTFDKVLTLDLGADDYIVKPFEPKELLARIKAVLRRYNNNRKEDTAILEFHNLIIDSKSYRVLYKGKEIKMPPKEFELLNYLAVNKNKVFTREKLLCEVWGYDYPGDSRTVDVHIKRLRQKLNDDEKWQIETVWGVGYKFEVK